MTKKDARIIAETIRNAPISEDAKQTVAASFATALGRTMLSRLNFDRETFIVSCMHSNRYVSRDIQMETVDRRRTARQKNGCGCD